MHFFVKETHIKIHLSTYSINSMNTNIFRKDGHSFILKTIGWGGEKPKTWMANFHLNDNTKQIKIFWL